MNKISNIQRSWNHRRVKAGLKQKEIAADMGVRVQYINTLFLNKGNPSMDTVDRIEAILSENGVPFTMEDFKSD